jgi:hypothetical protein
VIFFGFHFSETEEVPRWGSLLEVC